MKKNPISPEDQKELKHAIEKAEMLTSGEIRLFIDETSEAGPLDRAAFIFQKLKMHETELRNGVLIYVCVFDRKFAIIGDKGIHEKVGDDFWDEIKSRMLNHFKEGRLVHGLKEGIHEAGAALGKYFPGSSGDKNELSDEVLFGDGKS